MRASARAEDVALTAQHPLHVGCESLVRAQLDAPPEIPIIEVRFQARAASEISPGQLPHQTAIDSILRAQAVALSSQVSGAPSG
jgi:hypothetical protein